MTTLENIKRLALLSVIGMALSANGSSAEAYQQSQNHKDSAAKVDLVAGAINSPFTVCGVFGHCDYLYERVNIFRRDPQGYCKQRYGGDAYVRRIWGIPFCALPYNRRNVV